MSEFSNILRRHSESSTGLLADKVERSNKSRNSSTETLRAKENSIQQLKCRSRCLSANLCASGHGILGAGTGDGDAGGADGASDRFRHAEVFGDPGGEPAGKAIARADGIDRLDLGSGEASGTRCVHEQGSLGAESDNGISTTGCHQFLAGAFRVMLAAKNGGLVLVGGDGMNEAQKRLRQGARRSWIEDERFSCSMRKLGHLLDGAHRNLKLGDDGVAFGKLRGDGLDTLVGEQIVGGMSHRNHILAGFASNEDQRDATGNVLVSFEVPDVDPFTPKSLRSESPEIVVSARTDEDDVSARACRGHCLVGAFSSGGAVKVSAEKCFPGFRQTLADDDKVSIRAPEEQDSGGFGGGHERSVLRLFRGIQRGAHLLVDLPEERRIASQDLLGSVAALRQLSPLVAEP